MTGLSRRQALSALAWLTVGTAGSVLLGACAAASPAAPTATSAPAAAPQTPTAAPAVSPPPTTAPAAPTPTPAAQPAASGQKVTVELWHLHPEWKEGMAAVVKTFQRKFPSIAVNVVASEPSQYQNRLQTALNAGIGPDLFQHPARPQLDIMAATGQLMDLTGRVDISAWTRVAREAETVKGKIWGVPGGKYTVGIAYHVDIWEKAGIKDEPKTWNELTEAFARLKAMNIIPYSIAAKDGSLTYFNYIGLASSVLGLDGFNAVVDGKRKLTDPDLVAVIQQMVNWAKFYQPNFVGTAYLEAKALFATKKASAMDAGSSDYNGFRQINPNAQLGFMYWPAPDAQHQPCTNTGMEFQVGVNAKTKSPDAAIAFANWLGTVEGGPGDDRLH